MTASENCLRLNDVLTSFHCPACGKFLVQLSSYPKILPDCGHSICEYCIDRTVICPLCHVKVSKNGLFPETLQSNYQLKRLSEIARRVLERSNVDGCPHLPLVNNPTFCQHCREKYCLPCYTRHLEWIRLETLLFGSQIETRVQGVKTWLSNDPTTSFHKAVDTAAQKARSDVEKYSDKLEIQFKQALEEMKSRLFTKIDYLANAEKKEFEEFIGREKPVVPAVDEIASKLESLAETSPLHLDGGELCNLFEDIVKADKELECFEMVKCRAGKALIETDSIETDFKKLLEVVKTDTVLVCRFPTDLVGTPTFSSRIQQAIRKNDPAVLKSIFNSLPPICRRFGVEHYDHMEQGSYTPLLYAVKMGRFISASYLIEEERANWKARTNDDDKWTALHLAVLYNRCEMINLLLDNVPNIIYEKDGCGNTAVHYAVTGSNLPTVQCLFKHGVKVDQEVGNNKSTVLHSAARFCKNLPVFKFLLLKADKNAILQRDPNDNAAIHLACLNSNVDFVKCLLDLDPNLINMPGQSGYLPIHVAAVGNSVEVLKFLLKKAPEMIESRSHQHNITPLAAAVLPQNSHSILDESNNKEEAVGFLMRHGADATVRFDVSNRWTTPLELAVLSDYDVEHLDAMLAVNADLVNFVNFYGETLVDFARLHHKQECVDLLLKLT